MKPPMLILVCCALVGLGSCARKEIEANRHSMNQFITEHVSASRVTITQPATSELPEILAGEFSAAKNESEDLAKSEKERFTLLEGIDPARIERLTLIAQNDLAVTESVRSGIPLSDYLILVAIRSPAILAARESWLATVNRFEQADFLENLLGTYRGFVRELDTRVGPQTHRPMASMSQPFPSSIALKGEVVRNEVAMARIEYQMTVRDTLNRAASLYFELQYNFALLDVFDESATLYAQTVPIVQAQVESGGASQADFLRAQSQLALSTLRAQNARNQIHTTSAELNGLLNLSTDHPWPQPDSVNLRDVPLTQDALLAVAREKRQELQSAEIEVELARAMLRLAETMTLTRGPSPMSQLSNSAGPEAGSNRDTMTTFPNSTNPEIRGQEFSANAAYLEELRLRVTESEQRLVQAQARTEADVRSAHVTRENAGREYRAYAESVEPNVHQALASTRESYEAGSTAFSVFLDVEREHLEASLMRELARKKYNMSIIEERAVTGQSVADLVVEKSATSKGNPQ